MQSTQELTNIDVYQSGNFLFTRFDMIYIHHSKKNILLLENLGLIAKNYSKEPLDWTIDPRDDHKELYNKKILEHLLLMQSGEPDGTDSLKCESSAVSEIYRDEALQFNHIQITYKISAIPHVMMNWIACFSIFMNQKSHFFPGNFQFGSHELFNNINAFTNIDTLISNKRFENQLLGIMKQLLTFKTLAPELAHYQNALKDLEKLHDDYLANRESAGPKPLIQFLSDQNRCDMLYNSQFTKITGSQNSQQKDLAMLSIAASMVAEKYECLFMFELINTKNKIEFMLQCLGKKAHDNHKYRMGHTELMLIYFAEFRLFPDGNMGIINLDRNPAYLEFYAEGNPNYDILNDELYHLAPCLGIELEPGQNFHEENKIMFTKDCSPKLADLNLHLNANYGRALFNVHNTWAFFTRMSLAGGNLISMLPREILDNILLNTNPSFQNIYSDNQKSGFFYAAQLGKERGKNEHLAVIERTMSSMEIG